MTSNPVKMTTTTAIVAPAPGGEIISEQRGGVVVIGTKGSMNEQGDSQQLSTGASLLNESGGACSAPEQAEPYILEDQIGYVLRLAMQRHTAIFLSKMVDGLTQAQFATLARLYREGECAQTELGRLISFDPATMNGIVGRMKQRKLIASKRSTADKRTRVLSLTKEGRQVVERAIPTARSATEETLSSITKEEAALAISVLKRLA